MKLGQKVWNIFHLTDPLDLPNRWEVEGPWTIQAIVKHSKGIMYLLRFDRRGVNKNKGSSTLQDDVVEIKYDYECNPTRMFKTEKQALKECYKRN